MEMDATVGAAVRAAHPDDRAAVERLLAEAGLPADGLGEQFGEAYAVAEADGRLVGAEGIEVYGGNGLLRSAVVAPEWRGRGVGEALTRERLEWARARGLRAVYLLTTTAPDFFARFGFRRIERSTAPRAIADSVEFSLTQCASAAVMRLDLP
ncbi:MAG TPA: arsenic resistance N-acetyltransferase ArsN2 [Longimicrobium sp.]|nr:arsenic resistance N-acetyltransferase ArsN2 [Longimicrobium sp.]